MAFAESKTNKPSKKAAGKAGMDAVMAESDDFFVDKENDMPGMDAPKQSKKKTVEETYQKLTQLEHVLLRPDTYIGSTEMNRTKLWVYDVDVGLNQREVTYVPGLYKIFDEILVNAADNKQRDKNMDTLKVSIDGENNTISVWNNGQGIPVEIHKEEKCWVPELIFGHLLTSSNYNDQEKKTTGGRNGYGAKLANIFSTEFTVETADGARSGKKFKQTFTNNMQTKSDAKVKDCKASDNWTCISFKPDLAKFGMQCLDADIVALMQKRVHDMAGTTPGVKVYLQDERLKIKTFEDYCGLYLKAAGRDSESGEAPKHVHLRANDRWEIVVAVSEGQFQQVSFVNSIATTRGGSHVNHVADQVATLFLEHLAKKHKGLKLKPFQVKGHLWLFVNALIENPAFDSQTKETLTLKPSAFGSKVELDDKFFKKMMTGTGIMDSILSFGQEKQERDMKKTDGKKTGRITGIPKLEDANDAGTKNGQDCTLILTEGDSAKALAVSGLAVVGRNRYGVFPLRGKVANPRDANHEQIMKNEEIKNLKTILGLQQGNKYPDGPTGLRYGHVMIMADQDPDGSHIKGLLINLFHYYWPNLLKYPGFLKEFATPIVKAKKKAGKQEIAFFTLQEYEEWREATAEGLHLWTIKYYKGLGTSTSAEAKEYFSNLPLHQMDFAWEGAQDGEIIDMVFSKKRADDRKQWLLRYEDDLYVDHNASEVTYSDFVNKELIHFSMMDNMRSIPSLVDGLKPGQRKILYACFKRKLKAEIKVAQLAGYVAEHSAYHHGEQSLAMTIVNMAQSFVGSNNINLLVGEGQFGTRLQGGADAASPRYIFTYLNALTRSLFHESDDAILKYLDDDGQSIEPQWYIPVLPLILVNGGHGIGTGWSTDVPTYNPRDIVENIRRLLRNEVMEPMHPWFKGFKGQVELNVGKKGEISYAISGTYSKTSETTIEVTELPVNKWTQQYKEFLESMLDTDGGKKEPFIKGYKEWHTDTTVHFEISMSEKSMKEAEEVGIMKKFQLSRNLSTTNMHLFNAAGQIQKYDGPEQILREFFDLRLDHYATRKAHMIGELEKQLSTLDNKCRFIREVIAGTLKVSNRKKADVVEDLTARGYAPQVRESKKKGQAGDVEAEPEEAEQPQGSRITGFDYLLNMPIMSLTLERVTQLQGERDTKETELVDLQALSPADLWDRDLEQLMERYDQYEAEEAAKAASSGPSKKKGAGKGKSVSKVKAAKKRRKSWNASDVSESEEELSSDDDDDFEVAKKKAPAKRPAPAPAPRPAAQSSKPAKKVDTKETPDKSAMRPSAPVPAPKDDDDDDDLPTLSLFDRLNAKVAAPAAAPPKEKKAEPKKAAPAKPKAPPKKAKVDSDDDDFMEDAMSALAEPAPAPKDKPRRAAAKKPIVLDSDDEDDEVEEAQSEDEFEPEKEAAPKRKAAAAPKPRKKMVLDSEDEDAGQGGSDSEDFEPAKEKKKAAPAKKAAAPAAKKPAAKAKPVQVASESEAEEAADSDGEGLPVKKAAARRPGYGTKAVAKSKPSASTKDFEAGAGKAKAAPKKAAAAPKKAAPKKKGSDDDSDDFMGDAMGKANSDSEEEAAVPVRAAARPGRAAAAKKTYKLDQSSEEEDSEVEMLDEDSGSDFEA